MIETFQLKLSHLNFDRFISIYLIMNHKIFHYYRLGFKCIMFEIGKTQLLIDVMTEQSIHNIVYWLQVDLIFSSSSHFAFTSFNANFGFFMWDYFGYLSTDAMIHNERFFECGLSQKWWFDCVKKRKKKPKH